MRVWVRSDLHCPTSDIGWLHSDPPVHDVQVLAGDVAPGLARVIQHVDHVAERPVVLVAGNHEFYHRTLETELDAGRAASRASHQVHFLECEAWVHRGVRFLGATLWTDFALYGTDARSVAMAHAQRNVPDYSLVMRREVNPLSLTPKTGALRPADTLELHRETIRWLGDEFASPFDGPTVVVTHHAPARQSIAPKFVEDPLTPAYVSDLSSLIERWQPALWVHGHTHYPADYVVGRTRVVCNPRGFQPETSGYDPRMIVEVGS